jgi:hypothetical protein
MTARTWMSVSKTALGLTACLCLNAGCVLTETAQRPKEIAPTGAVAQILATWEPKVVMTPDVVHGGAQMPGLACRMYLLDPPGKPIQGEGSVIIDLREAAGADPQTPPKLLERWEISHDILQKLLSKDQIGWGYTLYLPWGTYRPEIQRVQLQIRYLEKGLPQFSPPTIVTLRNAREDNQVTVTSFQAPADQASRAAGIQSPPPAPPQPTR